MLHEFMETFYLIGLASMQSMRLNQILLWFLLLAHGINVILSVDKVRLRLRSNFIHIYQILIYLLKIMR